MVAMVLVYIYLLCMLTTSNAETTITPRLSIKDNNNDTLISADGSFQLGFFSPGNSPNRYLGMWYNTEKVSVQTVVWVANRKTPISDRSGVLSISSQGILQLSSNNTSITFWSSNSTSRPPQNPVAELLNSGNLVVRDGDEEDMEENILWQSFDHPSDTLLPGMKLGKDFNTGKETILTSWKSADDPAPGEFFVRIDTRGFPQLVIMKAEGPELYFRAGSWNGLRFSGAPLQKKNNIYRFEFIFNDKEVYYKFELQNSSVITRLVANQFGPMQRFVWLDQKRTWFLFSSLMTDECDNYASCGGNGRCNIQDIPACGCLDGFVPKFPVDWTDGCVRRTQLNCGSQDGFRVHTRVKLPDTSSSWFNGTMSLEMCREKCLQNCSCTAYANSDIRGSGCLLWFNDLMDIKEYSEDGQDLYIRMAASELVSLKDSKNSSKNKKIRTVVIPVILIGLILGGLVLCLRWKKLQKQEERTKKSYNIEGGEDDMELPLFDLDTIVKATDNFSDNNKLGQGGFGPVYKGTFPDGQEIAVKRLSKGSGQGSVEFKNEVGLIAKLQHRNLVRLLGCSIQGEEKMLVYEYMPNKSLDYFIFDHTKSKLLDWRRRMHIIDGIARGLLYLHQDSRLRIIHRDLKASNVLLDNDMNPKISDFGLARTVWGDQTEANTSKVVGTYGYMSPEYAVDGLFSIKSDVFSFGVLILEILIGKKNRGFLHPDHSHNLLGHAWKLWKEGRPLQLIDSNLGDSLVLSEVLRFIHIGLLCVQKRPEDRPNMSSIVLMFGSENPLPQPKQPGFFTERNLPESESSSSSHHKPASVNEVTISMLQAR